MPSKPRAQIFARKLSEDTERSLTLFLRNAHLSKYIGLRIILSCELGV